MRRLLLLLVLAFPVTASAQVGSWTLYYSDTPQVNPDGSITLTPTVGISGDDGGYCNVFNGMEGFETPAVLLNGNAWTVGTTAPAGGADYGGESIEFAVIFPDVTIAAGNTADLSFAGNVSAVCWANPDEAEEPDEPYNTFYGNVFEDDIEPNISPAPCFLGVGCASPWPNLYETYARGGHPVNLDSQQVAQGGQNVILTSSNCGSNNGWANSLVGTWSKPDLSCSQTDLWDLIPPQATCSVDSGGVAVTATRTPRERKHVTTQCAQGKPGLHASSRDTVWGGLIRFR